MEKINVFDLAETQLLKEKEDVSWHSILDYSRIILKFIDSNTKLTSRILSGKVTAQDKYYYKKQGITL